MQRSYNVLVWFPKKRKEKKNSWDHSGMLGERSVFAGPFRENVLAML